jgi:alpha-D-glucose phosphate-specific phosphoglucomutase
MPAKINFGTDGWRAVIAEDFTFPNVRACAQGVADYLKEQGSAKCSLVIGYDTRYASEDFAAACAEVLAANGIKAYLLTRTAPTPVTSFTITAVKADGGIMITASHNPGNYNGFKYKVASGCSAPTEIIDIIQAATNAAACNSSACRITLREAQTRKLLTYHDPFHAYAKQLGRLVDIPSIKKSKLKVVADYMFGAGIGCFSELLDGGNLRLHEMNKLRNPLFPGVQPEPIARNLGKLSRRVIRENASIGLATDGDADRVGVVDENGRVMTTQEVFALLAMYLLDMRKERGAIVKTLTSTDMLYRIGEKYGVPVFETPVGFKYVAPIMIKENALLGGEESGGYGFRGHIPERDGILAGLYMLDYVNRSGKAPSALLADLFKKVGPHYFNRVDTHIADDVKKEMAAGLAKQSPEKVGARKVIKLDKRDGFRFNLEDGSWLLIRFSGTEPLVRVYAESSHPDEVQKLLEIGQQMAGAA